MTTTVKEKTQFDRDMEQDKRILNYERDKECLEITKMEDDYTSREKYRVDNLLTDGAYIVEEEDGNLICTCPDYRKKCETFTPPLQCKHLLAVHKWKKRTEGMKNHKFDPQKYLIKIKGKDYLEVKFRLHWFRLERANWDIRTELEKLDLEKGISLVRADIYDEKGNHRSSGMKMEYQKNFFDYSEKAETGAIGRALAALGYGTLQSFELDEGIEKGRIVDAPVSLGGNNGGNGKVNIQTLKPLDNRGSFNGGNGNGREPKATLPQIRYIKHLCEELKIEAKINVASLSKARASEIIEGLQKRLAERKKK